MEEPKNPFGCSGGNTQGRREFLQKAAVVGAGLSVAALGMTAPIEARASTFDLSTCLGIANDNYEQCRAGALQQKAMAFTTSWNASRSESHAMSRSI